MKQLKKHILFLAGCFALCLFLLMPTEAMAAARSTIKLNRKSATLYTSGSRTIKLKATVTGKSKKVTWKSNKPSVASVNSKGKVTAQKAGTATITAKANGISAKCKIKVKKSKKQSAKSSAAKIKCSSKLTIKIGKSKKLKPSSSKDKKFTYKSSNSKVASVNKNGKITAKKAGKATITVKGKTSKKTAKCVVTVPKNKKKKSSVVKIKCPSRLTIEIGKSKKLKPRSSKDKKFTYKSSNSKVASVNKNGKITAKKAGKATITVKGKISKKTAKCVVTVTKTISANTVATIGSQEYSSLQSAFDAVKNGQTIVLQKDIDMGNKTLVAMNSASYTLDLNKKSIKNCYELSIKKGGLKIRNGSFIQNPGERRDRSVRVNKGAALTIESGTYRVMLLYVNGTLTIEGGTLDLDYLGNEKTTEIKGGALSFRGAWDSGMIIENQGFMKITGGTFKFPNASAQLENYNELYIKREIYNVMQKSIYTDTDLGAKTVLL